MRYFTNKNKHVWIWDDNLKIINKAWNSIQKKWDDLSDDTNDFRKYDKIFRLKEITEEEAFLEIL